jgi:hypothetical protein
MQWRQRRAKDFFLDLSFWYLVRSQEMKYINFNPSRLTRLLTRLLGRKLVMIYKISSPNLFQELYE